MHPLTGYFLVLPLFFLSRQLPLDPAKTFIPCLAAVAVRSRWL